MLPRAKLALTLFVVILLASTLATAGLVAGASPTVPALNDRLRHSGAHLLSSTEAGLTFAVTVPWQELDLKPVAARGKEYVQVSIPGWSAISRAGAPALPMLAQAIGVPFGATLSVDVQRGPAHSMTLPAPALPAATQTVELDLLDNAAEGLLGLPTPIRVVEADPAIYAGGAAYPGALAEVASDGMIRQQRVAGIVAYPVQYDPATRQLTVYESLTITVTFMGSRSSATGAKSPSAESVAYEQLLRQQLLNYETARPWRQPSAVTTDEQTLGTEEAILTGTEVLPWTPPEPGWRVKVRDEGFYQLTYAELAGAGLEVDTLDPRTFQLFHLGAEVAIQVTGEDDGRFDTGDAVLFYGQPVASKYTADNVYWLTYGAAVGARMASRDGTPGDAEIPAYYPAKRHLETNLLYNSLAPGGDDLERWTWASILASNSAPQSWSTSFALAAPYTGPYSSATLTVAMLGWLQFSTDPDHHVQVYLDEILLGDAWWDGIAWQVSQFQVPDGLLAPGAHTLTVVLPNDTGAGIDRVLVDWAELAFANTFRAEGDVLAFAYDAAGPWKFQVDGFTTDQLAVYDITTPAAPVRIEGIAVSGAGPYSVQFEDSLSAPAAYWAMAGTAYKAVQAIEADTPSDLQSTANGADYIVITHPDFAQDVALLRDWRASQGLRAALVDVQDVYDEFGYGLVGVAAIRDFLAYTYANWQAPAPSYVLLVGDGHYDPKDYRGHGLVSYIPPYLALVDPWIGETAADNRYVTVAGEDTMPDMMLGRMAVNSVAEAQAFVDKILAYEQSPAGEWQQSVLAVADNADGAGDFAALSDALLSDYLPASYLPTKVYYGVTHLTVSEARAAIQNGINAGALLVNYIGHAAIEQWAAEGLLKTSDVLDLDNGEKLPVVLPMTCYDGYYHMPTLDAVAEVLTRADNGAVASWSPTGLGVATGHDYLNRGFYRALFTDGVATVGEATFAGKSDLWASGTSPELLDTYLLFGDPATEFALPDGPPPTPTDTPPPPTPTDTPPPPTPTDTPPPPTPTDTPPPPTPTDTPPPPTPTDTPPLVIVNYYEDLVGGNYAIGHTFWITVNDGGGLVKATALTTSTVEGTGPDGAWEDGFATADEDWFPLKPDLIPHDRAACRSDDGYSNSVRLGTIEGIIDAAADTVSGTATVPWLAGETMDGAAGSWGFTFRSYTVTLDAFGIDTYFVDFSPDDVQLGQSLSVHYQEPDLDIVRNVIPERAGHIYLRAFYGRDIAEANTTPGAEVTVTVYDSQGNWKDQASATAGTDGECYILGLTASMVPGDWVAATSSDGTATSLQVIQIGGSLDLEEDTIAGTMYGPGADFPAEGMVRVLTQDDQWFEWPLDIKADGRYFLDMTAEHDVVDGERVEVLYGPWGWNQVERDFYGESMRIYLPTVVRNH